MNKDNINEGNNSSTGAHGNRGKFSDRLKKIRRDRLKLGKNNNLEELEAENVIKRGGRNFFKVILALPSVVHSVVKTENKKKTVTSSKFLSKSKEIRNDNKKVIVNHSNDEKKIEERKIKVNKIREINGTLLKKKSEIYLKENRKSNVVNTFYNKEVNNNSDAIVFSKGNTERLRIEKLQKEILDLIKKNLVENINKLEILQSELYVLTELSGEDLYLKECKEDIKEIKKMLSKIKVLKERYDYLRSNIDFEYMLEYEDNLLIDKILELKSICSNNDIKHIIDDYKILDEYKFLYLKIDKLNEDTIKFEEYKKEKEDELKKRDINFDKLKIEVYDVEKNKEIYEKFVKEQELLLKDLEANVSSIDFREEVTYKLKGFSQLLGNSFKYLGLLLANPLKGLIPGIATQTIVTRNLVRNLYNNLEWKENRKMVYEAIDYSDSINMALNNLDNTLSLVETTLEDISRLKTKYKKEFSKYQYSLSGYRDTIKKINKMENAVMGSKIKIQLMQQRMKEKEKQNTDKLKRLKKLNSSANN